MTANFTHRVIRSIPMPENTSLAVGTLLDGEALPRENRVALESGEFIVALTPEELEDLNKATTETATETTTESVELEKPVAKKAPAKKAPAKKAPVKKTVKKSVAK